MKKNRSVILIVIVILCFGVLRLTAGFGRYGKHSTGSDTLKEKVVYTCPMHPAYTSDKPGDCPICGMKLVKKENKPESKPAHVKGGSNRAEEKTLDEICVEHKCDMQNCPMMVKTRIKPGERIFCPVCGEVIITKNGKAVEIPIKGKTGMANGQAAAASAPVSPAITVSPERRALAGIKTETVKTMDLVKVVHASGKIAYDPALAVAEEEFIQALNAGDNVKDSPLADVVDRSKSLAAASRNKLKLLGMSDEEISIIEKTRTAESGLYLPAKGEDVWAYVAVYEYEISFVKEGDIVSIEAVAYPGEKFSGKVVSINPVLDPETRTNQVRVLVPNPVNKLKPEMFVNALIQESLGVKLAVSETAVLDTGLRKIVYVAGENNTLESREVTLGHKAEGYYEVLSGLKEGDTVVTSGNFLVDSETKLSN
ncbi:MAG: efflux RND transporter periplasmic adaptor subunit [Candidatus Omnitrophica bacterium]|nr:efflux RND transporter periplasmic adaptor subunit [Candidatus Omnitrophota bacterium]